MRVSVVGTGSVGLATGACHPIYEPHLSQPVTRNVRNGRARFTNDVAEAARAEEGADALAALGFAYLGIGRGQAGASRSPA